MKKLKLRKIGNSVGVILPKELLEGMQVQEGDELIATEDPDGVRLTPYDRDFADALEAFQETRRNYRNALRELGR